MLEKNFKDQEIYSFLLVSKETVRLHKFLWQKGNERYRKVLAKLVRKAELKELWKKLDQIVAPVENFVKARNDKKARAKLLGLRQSH